MRATAAFVAAVLAAGPAFASGPQGRWLTEDHTAVIEMSACDGGLCGRIVGMGEPKLPDGTWQVDWQGRPICGLTFLRVRPDGAGSWSGLVTNPETGSEWHCTLRLDAADHLLLRGYIGMPLFGETQTWTRYDGMPGAGCAMTE